MTDLAPNAALKQQMTTSFNALAPDYDQIRFIQVCAQRLIELTPLSAGLRVLDVATGTGVIALDVAQRIGATGSVVGVDIAPEMLSRSRHKLAQSGLTNVEFQLGDAEHLDFPAQSFDRVLCASSLFFFPDIPAALREWKRVLAPAGVVGFTSFGEELMQPLMDLWAARLQRYGLKAATIPYKRLGTQALCEAALHEAGYTEITVQREQLGYYAPTPEQRWMDILSGLEGKPLQQLTLGQREQIKAEHLADLAAHITSQGIWMNVDSLFAFGRVME
jgi:ubiquinone/menaquinone biosynthesis C-methylase UbiE